MRKSYLKTALLVSTALLMSCQSTGSSSVAVRAVDSDHWNVESAEPEGGKLYNMGRNYLAASQYGLAIDAFRRDIRVNGDNAMSLNGLGITYDMLGRYDLSQKYYQQALELQPELPLTYSNLAYSQYKQGAYENAIHLAEAAKEMVDVDQKQEGATGMKNLAHSNQMLAAKTALDETKTAKTEVTQPAEGHVIKREAERDWVMVKAESPKLKGLPERYKSNIAIAKILKRKEQIKEEKTRQIQEPEAVPPSIEEQIANVHEEIIWASALIEVPKPAHKPDFEPEETMMLAALEVPLPARKPEFEANAPALIAEADDTQETGLWDSIVSAISSIETLVSSEDPEMPAAKEEDVAWYETPVYTVLNGTGRAKMARRFSGYIASNGLEVPSIGDAEHYEHEKSVIEFTPEHQENAKKLAKLLPVEVELKETDKLPTFVKLTLGKDLLDMDEQIQFDLESI